MVEDGLRPRLLIGALRTYNVVYGQLGDTSAKVVHATTVFVDGGAENARLPVNIKDRVDEVGVHQDLTEFRHGVVTILGRRSGGGQIQAWRCASSWGGPRRYDIEG